MTCWLRSFNHHPVKFVCLAPCESENKIFLIFHVITQLKCRVSGVGWGPLILSCHPATFGVLMELEIITFVISVKIPIAIPIPWFQCRGLQMDVSRTFMGANFAAT